MWLTRPKSLKLHYLLNQTTEVALPPKDLAPHSWQAVMEFRRDAVLAEADFKTAFSCEAVSFPLGEQPVLLIDLMLDSSTELPMLTFQLATGQNLNLSLDQNMSLAIARLLSDVLGKSAWGIGSASVVALKELAAPAAAMLH